MLVYLLRQVLIISSHKSIPEIQKLSFNASLLNCISECCEVLHLIHNLCPSADEIHIGYNLTICKKSSHSQLL